MGVAVRERAYLGYRALPHTEETPLHPQLNSSLIPCLPDARAWIETIS